MFKRTKISKAWKENKAHRESSVVFGILRGENEKKNEKKRRFDIGEGEWTKN